VRHRSVVGRWLTSVAVVWTASGATTLGQQRPLLTEDPEVVGAGVVLVEGGFDYGRTVQFPVSGLTGHLWRGPLIGLSVGVSSIAEIQIDGGLYTRLRVTARRAAPLAGMLTFDGDTTSSIEDLVIGTKVRVVSEAPGRPALGVRFATRLPNASNESGLGLDTTDFYLTALVGKTVESVRIVGNVGLGILADPTRGDRQNDVLLYGVSVARAVAPGVEMVAEINGRADTRAGEPPPGTESRGLLRIGSRYTRGAWRLDAALFFGLTARDPGVGLAGGVTYVFRAFEVP
jgi:hypothetical protein